MSGKREKSACASMGHLPKLENMKMEVGEDAKRLVHAKKANTRGQIKSATSIYKNAILQLIITKMPLLSLKCWSIHLNDVAMMWQLSSTEYLCPSSKICFTQIPKNN